jgi:hypothetical protein
MGTIKLASAVQKALFVTELSGQISDGFWENASPHDHWEIMCRATVEVDAENTGIDFYPRRRYNFANKELLEVVGDRMIWYAKTSIAFPSVNTHEFDFSDGASVYRGYSAQSLANSNPSSYWADKIKVIEVAFGMSMEEAEKIINAVEYSRKDLIKDLKAIGKIVNSRS